MTEKVLAKIADSGDFSMEKIKMAFDMVSKVKGTLPLLDESDFEMLVDVVSHFHPDENIFLTAILARACLAGKISDQEVIGKFGKVVAQLIDGLKKLENLHFGEHEKEAQLEVFRKMFLVMAKDLRVVLIELALKLDLMKNLSKVTDDVRMHQKIAREVMDVYVPIAARLGIYRVKVDLEDLAFRVLQPADFDLINKQLASARKRKKLAIETAQKELEDFLKSRGFNVDVKGRLKSVYSTYRKMKRKGLESAEDLYDIFAMRIILPTQYDRNNDEQVDHLYGVLGMIHSEWKPLSRRFKDYIAVPKANGYRSLHTVILGLAPKYIDKPVEIQIRSSSMHDESEYGVAAHWLYKQTKGADDEKALQSYADWIKGLEKLQEDFDVDSDSATAMPVADIFRDRIFVLTPRGDVRDLPAGSTPLDFAYLIHTDIGHRCMLAKVNGVAVSLDYELNNGDVVDIVTRREPAPKLQWLSIVKTGFAKNKIKAWFSGLNRENNIREGKRLVNAQLERLNKAVLDQNYTVLKSYGGGNLNFQERERLLEEVGKGSQLASDIIRKIFSYQEILEARGVDASAERGDKKALAQIESVEQFDNQEILVGGEAGLPVRLANCCKPARGDDIVGYVTRGNTVSIHRVSCLTLDGLNKERIVFAQWKSDRERRQQKQYRVELNMTVMSRIGLIRDITSVISDMGINIVDMRMSGDPEGLHNDFFTLEMTDLDKFDILLDRLENIKGVVKVSKV